MRWMAGLAALALLSTSCSDEPTPDVATPTDTTTTTTTSTVPWAAPLATPWHEQVPFDPLGQDPADCFDVVDTGPTDPESGDTEPATIFGENWMISYDVPTLIDGVEVDRIVVDTAAVTLNPSADFTPSHLVTTQAEIARTLRWLDACWDVEFVAIPFAADDELAVDSTATEQLGAMFSGWTVVGDELISLTRCHIIYGLTGALREAGLGDARDKGGFVDGLRRIAGDRETRLRSMGLGGNEFSFSRCAAPNPGVIAQPGFSGPDMAFAWGEVTDGYGSPRLEVDD